MNYKRIIHIIKLKRKKSLRLSLLLASALLPCIMSVASHAGPLNKKTMTPQTSSVVSSTVVVANKLIIYRNL